jgi:hypothetical protein
LSCRISRSASIATRSRRDECAGDLGEVGRDPHAAAKRHVEEALHDEVGIAPDRRREVRVGLDREAEVRTGLRRVPRLLHRSQDDGVDQPFLGPPDRLLEHALDRLRADLPVLEREPDAEPLEEVPERLQRVGGRRLVHAVREEDATSGELAGDRLVRGEHELLDDLVRHRPVRADDLLGPCRAGRRSPRPRGGRSRWRRARAGGR